MRNIYGGEKLCLSARVSRLLLVLSIQVVLVFFKCLLLAIGVCDSFSYDYMYIMLSTVRLHNSKIEIDP